MAYIVGAVADYELIPCIFLFIPMLYIACFAFVPNTPKYYLHKQQVQVSVYMYSWKFRDHIINLSCELWLNFLWSQLFIWQQARDALKYYRSFKGRTEVETNVFNAEFERLKSIGQLSKRPSRNWVSVILVSFQKLSIAHLWVEKIVQTFIQNLNNFSQEKINEGIDHRNCISLFFSDDGMPNHHHLCSLYFRKNRHNSWSIFGINCTGRYVDFGQSMHDTACRSFWAQNVPNIFSAGVRFRFDLFVDIFVPEPKYLWFEVICFCAHHLFGVRRFHCIGGYRSNVPHCPNRTFGNEGIETNWNKISKWPISLMIKLIDYIFWLLSDSNTRTGNLCLCIECHVIHVYEIISNSIRLDWSARLHDGVCHQLHCWFSFHTLHFGRN